MTVQAGTPRKIQEGDGVIINNPKEGQETKGIVTGCTNTGSIRVRTACDKIIRVKRT